MKQELYKDISLDKEEVVESKAEKVHEELGLDIDKLLAERAEFSWAEEAKRGKVKKNLLLAVKTSTQEKMAANIKDEASLALNGTQITDSRFSNGGNIVTYLDNENKTLKFKIKCNVNKGDQGKNIGDHLNCNDT